MAIKRALTPLAVAALALLEEKPMHPYEMYQTLITRQEDRIVKVRPGSLYHAVDRLAADGLVEALATEREGRRPERTSYRITEEGERELAASIAETLSTYVNEFPRFPVAVAEAHNLPRERVIELLGRRREAVQAEIDRYVDAEITVSNKQLPRAYWLDVSYQRAIFDAEIGWLDTTIRQLEGGELPWGADAREQLLHRHAD